MNTNGMANDDIIKTYFQQNNVIVDHQIKSYNYFVETIIPQIISQFFPVVIPFNDDFMCHQKIKLDINNINVGKPS